MHHAQVDRVTAIWYNVHQKWTTDGRGADVYVWPIETLWLTTSNWADLTPFWNTQTTYWVSPGIIDNASVFNYGYRASTLSATAEDHVSLEEATENPARNPAERNTPKVSDDQMTSSAEASGNSLSDIFYEWSVTVKCKQFELGGSFSVFVFLGDVPPDPKKWLTDPAYAGTFDVFTNSTPEECANCSDRVDLILRGFVHINDAILKRSGQHSLEPHVVTPYLKSNLNWRVLKVGS